MQKDAPDVAQEEREWIQRMADLEDEHGGFPGFSGRLGRICPICGLVTFNLSSHSAALDDPGHVLLHVMES